MLTGELLKRIRRIEITTRRAVEDVLAGQYHSVFKGRGMVFDEVRPYQPGDDIRTIDWNVTARMNDLYVKQFVEERELTVMLLVDTSASQNFGTRRQFKAELAAELSGLLAFSAIQNNDRVGLVMFTDRVESFVPPKKGRKHVLRVISEVLTHRPQHTGTSIASALQYLSRVMRRKAVVFLISDFLDGGFEQALRVVQSRHDLVCIWLSDLLEQQLPPAGLITLEDAESGRLLVFDAGSRSRCAAFTEETLRRREQLRRMFGQMKVDYIELMTGQDYLKPLILFFRRRERRR